MSATDHHQREQILKALPLSEPMFLILLTLSEEETHGYAILQSIESRSEGRHRLRTGTLYNALARLSRQDLIALSAEEEKGLEADTRRRTYCITQFGRAVLKAETERLQQLVRLAQSKPATVDQDGR